MKYRTLRIAFSAVCGILCLLLIVLWVRSYWRYGVIECRSSNRPDSLGFIVRSMNGKLMAAWFELGSIAPRTWPSWNAGSCSLEEAGVRAATLRDVADFSFAASSFVIPYWFLSLATGALSVLLAVRQPYRFSLRTLLIATTVVAVVLGLIIALSRLN